MKNLKDVMSTEVSFATPETSLADVAKMMVHVNCGEIPVVNNETEKSILGVITDRDIVCRTLGVGKNPMKLIAQDCMTTQVVTANKEASISEGIEIMKSNKIRRIPIVDDNKNLCGIVSLADLVGEGDTNQTMEMIQEVSHSSQSPSAIQ